jgi:hypothetical protein
MRRLAPKPSYPPRKSRQMVAFNARLPPIKACPGQDSHDDWRQHKMASNRRGLFVHLKNAPRLSATMPQRAVSKGPRAGKRAFGRQSLGVGHS